MANENSRASEEKPQNGVKQLAALYDKISLKKADELFDWIAGKLEGKIDSNPGFSEIFRHSETSQKQLHSEILIQIVDSLRTSNQLDSVKLLREQKSKLSKIFSEQVRENSRANEDIKRGFDDQLSKYLTWINVQIVKIMKESHKPEPTPNFHKFTRLLQTNTLVQKLDLAIRSLQPQEQKRSNQKADPEGRMFLYYRESGQPYVFTQKLLLEITQWLKQYAFESCKELGPTLVLLGPTAAGKSTLAQHVLCDWLSRECPSCSQNFHKFDFTGQDPKDVVTTLVGQSKAKTPGQGGVGTERGLLTENPNAFIFLDEVGSYESSVKERLKTLIDDRSMPMLWGDSKGENSINRKFYGTFCFGTNKDLDALDWPNDLRRRFRTNVISLPSMATYLENLELVRTMLREDATSRHGEKKWISKEFIVACVSSVKENIEKTLGPGGNRVDHPWFKAHGFGIFKEIVVRIIDDIALDIGADNETVNTDEPWFKSKIDVHCTGISDLKVTSDDERSERQNALPEFLKTLESSFRESITSFANAQSNRPTAGDLFDSAVRIFLTGDQSADDIKKEIDNVIKNLLSITNEIFSENKDTRKTFSEGPRKQLIERLRKLHSGHNSTPVSASTNEGE